MFVKPYLILTKTYNMKYNYDFRNNIILIID